MKVDLKVYLENNRHTGTWLRIKIIINFILMLLETLKTRDQYKGMVIIFACR